MIYKIFFIVLSLLPALAYSQTATIHHDIKAQVNPKNSSLVVTDKITLSSVFCKATRRFTFPLHKGLKPSVTNKLVELSKIGADRYSVDVEIFEIKLKGKTCKFEINYGGKIFHSVQSEFSPGTIGTDGISLSGSTYWYPMVADQLVSFNLNVTITDPNWSVVSQGALTKSSTEKKTATFNWQQLAPQDDIYLMAGNFHHYTSQSGTIKAEVFLRQPDKALADNFLRLTHSYIDMYSKMLGPYPYSKFALIENFWETGFGMPSFTLLGPSVIRLPFIGYTSYPHEILHNWWGNGVYVDYSEGNWAEGLTVYLADHHLKQLRGQGHNYRQTSLQDFSAYVTAKNDFPLKDFIQRSSKSSQAIGYAKAAMFFHMLRIKVGDPIFFKSLQKFYRDNLYKRASYSDLKKSFQQNTNQKLDLFFDNWISRKGAPKLRLAKAKSHNLNGSHQLSFELQQMQNSAAFPLTIPYKVELMDKSIVHGKLNMFKKTKAWTIPLKSKPLRISIDPGFDVFRQLFPQEIPASLSTLFGESKDLVLVLPKQSPELAKYQMMVQKIQKRLPINIEVLFDDQLSSIPKSGAIWIMGWENSLSTHLQKSFELNGAEFNRNSITIKKTAYDSKSNSIFIALKTDPSLSRTIVWSGLNANSDVNQLMRKIFHYGKYSYVGFDNNSQNKIKGIWQTLHSPLSSGAL